MNSAHTHANLYFEIYSQSSGQILFTTSQYEPSSQHSLKLGTFDVVSSFSVGLSQLQAFLKDTDYGLYHKHPRASPVTSYP